MAIKGYSKHLRVQRSAATLLYVLYSHVPYHNDTIIKTHAGRLLYKNICTSHFIARVRKGYSRFACERVLETEQKLQYFDPHSYGRQRCVFLVLLMLNRRPRGPLCWVLAFFTASCQHLLWTPTHQGFPRAPLVGCGFPYHISTITPSPALTGTRTQLNCLLS